MSQVTLHGHPVKVGDRIWSFTCGYIVVTGLSPSSTYPIITTSGSYNMDGSLYFGEPSQVFWQPIAPEAIEAAKVKPEPEYEWQWLVHREDGGFGVSKHYYDFIMVVEANSWARNCISFERIEASKREVQK